MVNYQDAQDARDSENKAAWDRAPQSFKKKAALVGINGHEPEGLPGMAMEYDETKSRVNAPTHAPSFFTPDMADTLDTVTDRLIEKYAGMDLSQEDLIKNVVEDLKEPMNEEIEKSGAIMLGRIAMYMVKSETNNIYARSHALLHAIPRLASKNGYPSMRQSAKACRVSPEWMRRTRDWWVGVLGIKPPVEGVKSESAKERYRENGLNNHWRHQRAPAAIVAVAVIA